MIVTVVGEKGGTGKTTIATNLAIMRAIKAKSDVMLVDADPQKSASNFNVLRRQNKVKPLIMSSECTTTIIDEDLELLTKKHDDVIVDVGGRDTEIARLAMVPSDILVVPIKPGVYDIWSLSKFAGVIEKARKPNSHARPGKPPLRVLMVINMAPTDPRVGILNETLEAIEGIPGLTIAKTHIGDRLAFREAANQGKAVIELSASKYGKAISEIEGLYKEVFTRGR